MKKYVLIIVAVFTVALYSCAGKESSKDDLAYNIAADVQSEAYAEDATEEYTEEDSPAPPPAMDISEDVFKSIERKLIKEGSITFETEDCKATKILIQNVANSTNGYLSRDDEYTYNDRIQHNITIRVPSANFDKLLTEISQSIKEIEDQNISVKDVTEEFVDVEARLKAKKIVEQRYLDLLDKAHSVGDILQVENELARLRVEIESTEGRLRYLKDQVSLSTLSISFYQNTEKGFRFGEKAKNGLNNGYKGLLWFFIGLINIWPFLLFVTLLIWFLVKWIRRSGNKSKIG